MNTRTFSNIFNYNNIMYIMCRSVTLKKDSCLKASLSILEIISKSRGILWCPFLANIMINDILMLFHQICCFAVTPLHSIGKQFSIRTRISIPQNRKECSTSCALWLHRILVVTKVYLCVSVTVCSQNTVSLLF